VLGLTHTVDPVTGNLRITERNPLSFCLPSGIRNCTSFTPSGLTVDRTITTERDGRVVRIVDVFTSTDGAPHTYAIGYYESYSPGAQPGYQFPGESELTAHVSGESIFGRAAPSATLLAIGDRTVPASLSNPIGAMTLAPAPEGYRVLGRPFEFAISYRETVPAGGSSTIAHAFAMAESRDELDGYVAENTDVLLAPEVAINTPAADGSTVDAADLAVSGTASDDTTGLTVDGTATTVSGGAWSRTLTLTPGANTITVVARDAAGNTTTATREVTYAPPAAPAAASPTPAASILVPAPAFARRCAVDGIPSNRFSIRAHTKGRGGTILVRAKVPGCGRLQVLGTHRKRSAMRSQLSPGAGRFAWGSKTVRTGRAGMHTVAIRVEPNQRGRALMARYASSGSRLRIRLTVAYRPEGGTTRRHVVRVRVPVG
jgi:hypothetical protein